MASPIHTLRTAAFEVPADGLGSDTHVIDFPGAWLAPLRELVARSAPPSNRPPRIPIRSLNAALQAVVPDLAISLPYVTRQTTGDQPWLVSNRALPTDRLMPLVAAWVHAQRTERTPESVLDDAITAIAENPLTSHQRGLDEISSAGARLRILEAQAAGMLTSPDAVFDTGSLQLSFVRTASADGSGGEVMSWPPVLVRGDQTYSFLIRASAQTLPGEEQPLLYFNYGVRRWMLRTPRVMSGNSIGIYFQTSVPYIEQADDRRHFTLAKAIATLVTTRDEDGQDRRETQFSWRDTLIKVLQNASLSEKLPNLDDLMRDPITFRTDPVAPALIPFKYGRDSMKQGVSAGIGPLDRNQLLDWTASVVKPATPCAPLTRASVRPKRIQVEKKGGLQRTSVLPHLAATIGSRLTIELMTTTAESTQLALTALSARLPDVDLKVGAIASVETSGGMFSVTVVQPEIRGRVVAPLAKPEERGDAGPAIERARNIHRAVEHADGPTITIAEIEPAETFTGELAHRDPKNSIRHGLARTGRISQFVNPVVEDEPDEDSTKGSTTPTEATTSAQPKKDPNLIRHEKAIDDAFRQLGVRPGPFLTHNPIATPDLRYLSFWMLRRNKTRKRKKGVSVPLAVLMNVDGSSILVRSVKIDWMPLHEFTHTLGARYGGEAALERDEKGETFIQSVLNEVCKDEAPVLLLTHAQNLRSVWKFLQNPNIGVDQIGFGDVVKPIKDYPNLRHVRVRTSAQDETPEVFGYREGEEAEKAVGKSRGLWNFRGGRLYGSTADKPSTDTKTKLSHTKLRGPEEPRPGLSFPRISPQLVEIYVAGLQPGDDPVQWAALVHELRDANPYHVDELVLPWPLRIAERLGEYITPDYVEPDDEGDAVPDDDA